jgi:hypothetical protein
MSFVSEYLTPFLDYYSRLLDGPYLSDQLKYKGGQEVGGDYVNKVRRANKRAIEGKYLLVYEDMTMPSTLFAIPLSPDSSQTTCPDCFSIVPP